MWDTPRNTAETKNKIKEGLKIETDNFTRTWSNCAIEALTLISKKKKLRHRKRYSYENRKDDKDEERNHTK